MNVLLVWPATPGTFWSFSHVLPFISRKAAFPPLGLLTVAAMLPREWSIRLVDLNVTRLTDAAIDWADVVFLSGMLVQFESASRVIARCAARGRRLIAGGPLFTTGHQRFPELAHVVLGEAEDVMPQVVADLRAGSLQPCYESRQRPDVRQTPIPRWDLLDLRHYATMPIQFSRGCPFNCEFCDIIVMNGRTPRAKSPAQVIAELDALRAAGWDGGVFIVDDNFIGNKPQVKGLLRALIAWGRARGFRTTFTTEASLNVVDDDELLDLLVQAGFKRLFVGIESPSEASLSECAKSQNTQRDLVAAVRKIHQAGIEVMGGFIVGFDSDEPTIFEQQQRFIQESGVVTAMVGLLTALPGTQLFSRLSREGRIVAESTGNNLDAAMNFIPRLDRDTLIEGYRRLVQQLYAPRTYYRRIRTFLRDFRPSGPRARVYAREVRAFLRSLWVMGVRAPGRREFWKFLAWTALFHRSAFSHAMYLAITGHHFRKVAAAL
ncbi:MAG: DUF4070 domain-containing protein [Phycisphaerales bacterium]|nr:DUF4070 domain-containing protein [Phycisphaerales bacterium]